MIFFPKKQAPLTIDGVINDIAVKIDQLNDLHDAHAEKAKASIEEAKVLVAKGEEEARCADRAKTLAGRFSALIAD
jgi:hypothetical protein